MSAKTPHAPAISGRPVVTTQYPPDARPASQLPPAIAKAGGEDVGEISRTYGRAREIIETMEAMTRTGGKGIWPGGDQISGSVEVAPFASSQVPAMRKLINGRADEGVMRAVITMPGEIEGHPQISGLNTRTDIGFRVLELFAERKSPVLTDARFGTYINAQLAEGPNHVGRIGDLVALKPDLAPRALERVEAELAKTHPASTPYPALLGVVAKIANAMDGGQRNQVADSVIRRVTAQLPGVNRARQASHYEALLEPVSILAAGDAKTSRPYLPYFNAAQLGTLSDQPEPMRSDLLRAREKSMNPAALRV